MSWAQWFADSPVPGVLRAKLVRAPAHGPPHPALAPQPPRRAAFRLAERCRHDGLGCRFRRLGRLERARPTVLPRDAVGVARASATCSLTAEWTPLADHPGDGAQVYASRWDDADKTLWTVVNRSAEAHAGAWLVADDRPGRAWFDLVCGTELTSTPAGPMAASSIGGELPPGGIAAVLASAVRPALLGRRLDPDDNFPARAAVRVAAPTGAAREHAGRHGRGARRTARADGSTTGCARPACTARHPTSTSGSRCRRACTSR